MKKYIRNLASIALCLSSFLPASEPLSDSINLFASHFYQETLAPSHKNELFSPYCLFNCLGMAYIGSNGSTESEIRNVLCLDLPQDALARSLKELSQSLLSNDNRFELNIANSLWMDQNSHLLPSYLNSIQEELGGHVESLKFRDANKSVRAINEWVSKETKNTIRKILNPQDVSEDTKAMLVSALYFKGNWTKPFKTKDTLSGPFYKAPAESKLVPMMTQSGRFSYYENDEMQLLILPFSGKTESDGQMACIFVLPKKSLHDVESSLQDLSIYDALNLAEHTKVDVTIPRFEIELNYDLIPMLSQLGIQSAFSSRADFSKMNGNFDLRINKAIHKTFFSLNEKGVTASAATAIGIGVTCVRPIEEPAVSFVADHPFLFGIVDLKSNVMLFLGKMIEP